MKRLVQCVLSELKQRSLITFKESESKVLERGIHFVKVDFNRERDLDRDVNLMMDDLDRQNPDTFQRYKMFPLLKKRLAKEKGIIL